MIFLILSVSIPVFSLNTSVSTDKYLHRQWTSLEGLPNNRITAISQDLNGFIWIGTVDGLARFDGNEFVVYSKVDTKDLKSNHITALTVVKDGTLWIGTDGGGITIYKNHSFYHLSTTNRLPSQFIRSFSEPSKNQEIKIDTAKGCVVVLPQRQGLRVVRTLTESAASGEMENLSNLRLLTGHGVGCYIDDQDDQIWAGTDNGLFRLKPNKSNAQLRKGDYRVELVTDYPGLGGEVPVTALFQDSNRAIWIGTNGKGLHYLKNPTFRFYTVKNGLSHNFVKSVYQDRDETVWIGTSNGLNRYRNDTFTTFSQKDGLAGNDITAIFRDRGGDLWVGTSDGLNRVKQADFNLPIETFSVKNGLPANTVQVIHEDRSGSLWFGNGDMGLTVYQDGRFIIPHQEDRKAITPGNTVYAFAEDNAARLWIGTQQGLFCIDLLTSRYRDFDSRRRLSQYIIRDIYMDWEKTLWLGTAGSGVICVSAGLVYNYPLLDEFSTADVYKICEDSSGVLWIASGSGLFAFDKHQLDYNRYVFRPRRRARKAPYFRFLESDGLKSDSFNGGFQPSGWTMTDNTIWFPTTGGVAVMEPGVIKLEKKPHLPVVIEKIENRKQPIQWEPGKALEFSDRDNEIAVFFSVLNFNGYENLSVRYRLMTQPISRNDYGTIPVWQRKVIFRGLKSGKYRLELLAGNDEKGWNDTPARMNFNVTYTLPWADIALFVLIVFSAFSLLAVSRIMERRRSSKELMRIFKEDERYKTSGLNMKTFRMHVKQILELMEKEKVFLDPNISVTKMAERLDLPKEHISQIINKQFYLNFNQFINKYRVEEAKKLLLDPKESQFVVLKIAHDVGFNSKSTFNTAFKKFTGMSPSEFREKKGGETGTKS